MTKAGYPSRGRSRSDARTAKARAKKPAAPEAPPPAAAEPDEDIPNVLARYLALERADADARDFVLHQVERKGVTKREVASAVIADLTEVKRLMDQDPGRFSDLRMGFSQRQKHLELLHRLTEDTGDTGPGIQVSIRWPRVPRSPTDVGDRPKTDEHDPGRIAQEPSRPT